MAGKGFCQYQAPAWHEELGHKFEALCGRPAIPLKTGQTAKKSLVTRQPMHAQSPGLAMMKSTQLKIQVLASPSNGSGLDKLRHESRCFDHHA